MKISLAEVEPYLGQTMGEYITVEHLQTGSFGLILVGRNNVSGDTAAIKILRPDASVIARAEIENEDAILQKLGQSTLSTPNVIRRLTSGEQKLLIETRCGGVVPVRVPYIVLQLASCSIEELLPRRHDLSWPERLNLLCGITQGVHQLHKAGIVHRDIKSSNGLVHVDRNTGTCTSVLADLGRARDLTREASRPPHEYFAGMGDFRFAPPEALYLQTVNNPQLWRLTDLYGVGSLFFELATGQGITSYALGAGHDIVEALENTGELKRRALYDGHLTKIRARYADAFDHFATLVPDCIAEPSVTLLRQLCDPDPYRRLPGSGMRPCEPGLAWLERRVRILKLKAQIADRSKSGREEEKGMGGCC